MGRVLVTPRSATANTMQIHPALKKLEAAGCELVFPSPGQIPTLDQQIESIGGCVGYLAGVETIGREVLDHANELRVISRNGTGADGIDLDAARDLGISVRRTPGANAQSVAELAIGLILCLARNIPYSVSSVAKGEWGRRQGHELSGKTLSVVGFGQVGRRVAKFAGALGMTVVAHDAYSVGELGDLDWVDIIDIDEAIERADFLTLHCPPTDTPLIDDHRLSLMKDGAYIVNTARASLVDETAIVRSLDNGKVAGYASDVFEHEPPGITALSAHPRFIGTAHIGGFTVESVERALVAAVDNLLDGLENSESGSRG